MNERTPLLDDAVLAAAAKVIAEHGWHEFTLERVAQAAGISRVTLYRKGATRELLVEALVVGAAQAWQAGLWPALTGPGTAAERLRAALRASCVVVEQHLSLLAGLTNAPDPVFHLDGGDTRNVYVAPFERLLHDGLADGSLRATLDPATTALLLFNIVPRTYIHLRAAHQWSPDRTAEALLDLLMPGVLPERP
ncbi:TetR/AcrR family transcriptional regulator [Lentzea sp. NPDC003310]|uniref:TetR/AcrR family transcriptional regulator n=1 Tax=Lentzea sp. NPDC003310 TaxID=3154447 RepID=UPI00339E5F8F